MEDSLKLINDAQRQALAQIVVRRFDRRISDAQQKIEDIAIQIEKAIAKPFDPEKVEAEIKRFRTLVDNLEARKRDLQLVQTLSAERDATEQAVWLAASVDEAKRLVQPAEPTEGAV